MEESQDFVAYASIDCSNTDCYLDFDEERPEETTGDKASDEEEDVDEPIENIIPHLETACKLNELASDDDVQYLLDNVIPETKAQKCFVACWLERLKIVGINTIKYGNATYNRNSASLSLSLLCVFKDTKGKIS